MEHFNGKVYGCTLLKKIISGKMSPVLEEASLIGVN